MPIFPPRRRSERRSERSGLCALYLMPLRRSECYLALELVVSMDGPRATMSVTTIGI